MLIGQGWDDQRDPTPCAAIRFSAHVAVMAEASEVTHRIIAEGTQTEGERAELITEGCQQGGISALFAPAPLEALMDQALS
ncbi:hypothetical protein [Halorhodospira sp. 9622]|uniref:hypothetical protein n=1 Tax=Halorhodospira sp. 9622 TaxID=2899136 RepID=UPI001EE87BBC|nr:hypothetical protein [Halorhodospira sp. 9622]MCG5538166.1 hypothetical protein [Halorhodospira sp. 9622]